MVAVGRYQGQEPDVVGHAGALLMQALGLLGAVVAACAAHWYVYSILRGETRPHRTTWGVWTLIGVLGTGSAVDSGAGPGAYVALVYLALHVAVFLLSLSRRFGKPGGEPHDGALGLLAVSAIVLWQVAHLPAGLAATVAVVADGLALWPTLRESWRQPRTESLPAWLADSVAALLGVIAIAEHRYASMAYPVYLALGNSLVAGCLLLRRVQARTELRCA